MTISDFIKQLTSKALDAGAEDAEILSVGTGRDVVNGMPRRYIVVNAETTYNSGVKVHYKIEIDAE